eukprot:3015606-Pyramimonas_sp.AAC.1
MAERCRPRPSWGTSSSYRWTRSSSSETPWRILACPSPCPRPKAKLALSDGVISAMLSEQLRRYSSRTQSWLEVVGLEVAAGKA